MAAVLGVAAVIALATGFFTAGEDPGAFTSKDQNAVLSKYGQPGVWVLADGPVTPGGPVHRIESWYFPEAGTSIRFVDGDSAGEAPARFTTIPQPEVAILPQKLHRNMSRADVEDELHERGTTIPMRSDYPGSEAVAYLRPGLLVTYLDGKFFTAQMYFPKAAD